MNTRGDGDGDLRFRLDASVRSPGRARQLVDAWLNRSGLHDARVRRSTLLIISELVTNAVTHARSAPRVFAAAHNGWLRLEVYDESVRPPIFRTAGADGGFGLHLVADAADEWGWEPTADGKVVWTEIRC